MAIKGIIFDLDGTLLYTLVDLQDSVNYALIKNGLKKRTIEEIKSFVGNGIEKLIERAVYPKKEKFDICLSDFKHHYKKNSINKTKPYFSVVENLKKLKQKGFKLAVLSNKIDSEVKKLCDYFFFGIFDIALGAKEDFLKKPDSKSTLYIIEQLNLSKQEVVLIGDSEVDIKTAKNAQIECLSVSWGYKDKDFLIRNNAAKIFDDFSSLSDYLLKKFI